MTDVTTQVVENGGAADGSAVLMRDVVAASRVGGDGSQAGRASVSASSEEKIQSAGAQVGVQSNASSQVAVAEKSKRRRSRRKSSAASVDSLEVAISEEKTSAQSSRKASGPSEPKRRHHRRRKSSGALGGDIGANGGSVEESASLKSDTDAPDRSANAESVESESRRDEAGESDRDASGRRHRRRHRGGYSDKTFQATDQAEVDASETREDGRPADIAPHLLDPDGLRILNRLHRCGFEAYFVGGCVRDLLLGASPKDFDISTSARPEEIRALFGNCRLIGRRFRLAHVFFRDGKIIEVSTFRASPTHAETSSNGESMDDGTSRQDHGDNVEEDLFITRDNVFGNSQEDALRRDLTINGLFYDVKRGRVIDFSGQGIDDLRAGIIRTIGEPSVRMREDPVRILRAIRFAARFGFKIDEATRRAMDETICELPRCSAPRLLEETFKFLRAGVSAPAFQMLFEVGALDCLLPPIARWLRHALASERANFYAQLATLDALVKTRHLDDAILLSSVISPLLEMDERGRLTGTAMEFLEELSRSARLPKRIVERIRQMVWAESILSGKLPRKRSLRSFRNHPDYAAGLDLLAIHAAFDPTLQPIYESWAKGEVPVQIQKRRTPPQKEVAPSTETSGEVASNEGPPRKRRSHRNWASRKRANVTTEPSSFSSEENHHHASERVASSPSASPQLAFDFSHGES